MVSVVRGSQGGRWWWYQSDHRRRQHKAQRENNNSSIQFLLTLNYKSASQFDSYFLHQNYLPTTPTLLSSISTYLPIPPRHIIHTYFHPTTHGSDYSCFVYRWHSHQEHLECWQADSNDYLSLQPHRCSSRSAAGGCITPSHRHPTGKFHQEWQPVLFLL